MTDEQSAAAAAFARQRAAMGVEGLTCPEKALLLVLAIMGDRAGRCHPSIATLAMRASCGRRTAFRSLDRLAERGLIKRDTIVGTGTWYSVRLDECTTGTSAAEAPVPETTPTRASVAPNQPVTTKRKKTTSSPSTRDARFAEIAALVDLPALPATASLGQWADFAIMRAEMTRGSKPKPWSASAARKAITKLTTLAADGHNAGAVLDASVLNGWQGLFPVKDDHGQSDRLGDGGGGRYGRARPVDGFTAAIREAAALRRARDDGGG